MNDTLRSPSAMPGPRHLLRANRLAVVLVVLAVLAACVVGVPVRAAGVRKCTGEGGVPVYQDAPCREGRELRDFERDPPALSVLPAPPRPATVKPDKPSAARVAATDHRTDRRTAHRPARGDATERRHVHTGMTAAEVVARLGRPDHKGAEGRKGAVLWSYMPAPGDPDTLTTLRMERGVVVDVERRIVRR